MISQKTSTLKLIDKYSLPNRPKRNNLNVGQKIVVISNLYPVNIENKQQQTEVVCYQYDVIFSPEVANDNRDLRYQLFRQARQEITARIGQHYFSGQSIYVLRSLSQQEINNVQTIPQVSDNQGNSYSLRLNMVANFTFNQQEALLAGSQLQKKSNRVTQLINIIIKQSIRQQNLKEIGRNSKFFYVQPVGNVEGLEVYKGMTCSVSPSVAGINIRVDYACRILRQQTALQYMLEVSNGNIFVNKEAVEKAFEFVSVITVYNNYQIYLIDYVNFKLTPESTFLHKKQNRQMSYIEYFKITYGIVIKEKKQPLLVCKRKVRQANSGAMIEETVHLVPEICRMTGLTDEQRKNNRLMRDLSQYTKLNPQQRQRESSQIIQRLTANVKNSGIAVNTQDPRVEAIVVNPPNLFFGNGKNIQPFKGNFDIRQPIREKQLIFEEWVLIYSAKERQQADNLYELMKKAASTYGIQVKEPIWFEMNNINGKEWVKQLDEDFRQNGLPRFVVSSIPHNARGLYEQLKDFLYCKVGLEHQNVKSGSLQKNGMSVASKIVLQIASKLGNQIWATERPKELAKNTMLVGIETSMKCILQNKKRCNVVGVVASVDAEFTKYYNEVDIREQNDNQLHNLTNVIKNALNEYLRCNKSLPEEVVIYRQGQGEGQVQSSLTFEIQAIQRAFEQIRTEYSPRFAYFQVNKKISEKFYSQNNNNTENPVSGTIVADNRVVSKNFEFFLCAQNCNSGVCTPTKYLCLYNSLQLTEESFWQLSYWQCFNYYNWQGPVRIPGCMMYASKLAKFTSDVLEKQAISHLFCSKYYL